MRPWFKGFRGTIVQIDTQKFVINGEVGLLDDKSFEITELPVRTWTQAYKESTLEILLNSNEKTPSFINEYKEYHTESTVRFVITLSEANLRKSLDSGIHKTFKLQSSLSTTSMVLFDHNGCLKRYETPEEILEDYFPVRLEYYVKRKAYYEGKLEAEALKLENQAKFILEKNEGKIRMENVRKKEFVRQLIDRRYDSDPVKAWVAKNVENNELEGEERSDNEQSDIESYDAADAPKKYKKYDFDYLFDMSMRCMLREKVDELLKQRDNKKQELERLKRMTPQSLWEDDLSEFVKELDAVEEHEHQMGSKPYKPSSKAPTNKSRGKKESKLSIESKSSDFADRVEPKIDAEVYQKIEKLVKKANEKKFCYTILAVNENGIDEATVEVIVLGSPSPPKGPLKAEDIHAEGCTLKWKPPEDNGGAPIDHYTVEELDPLTGVWVPVEDTIGPETQLKVRGLQPKKKYKFRVKAVYRQGDSEPLNADKEILANNPFDEPGKPGTPLIDDYNKDFIKLKWKQPESDGGSPITGYIVEKKDKYNPDWVPVLETIVTDTTAKVPDLVEGNQYEFRVRAVNKGGAGEPSDSTGTHTARAKNAPPKIDRNAMKDIEVKKKKLMKLKFSLVENRRQQRSGLSKDCPSIRTSDGL